MKEHNELIEVRDFFIEHMSHNEYRVMYTKKNGYKNYFGYSGNPTGNCQLSSAVNIFNIFSDMNKYRFRDILIKLRKSSVSKNLLLIDIQKYFEESVVGYLPPSAIISKTNYTSSNGNSMVIMIIKLNKIFKLKEPKKI